MKTTLLPRSLPLSLLLLPLLLSGCANSTPPTRYYSLATPQPLTSDTAHPELRLGIGPITLPQRIDRREILVRSEPQQLTPLPFDLWSGNLREEIQHRLGQRLAAQLGTEQLHFFPFRGAELDHQVRIELLELSATPGEQAELLALWELRGASHTPRIRRSHYQQSLPEQDIATLVQHYGQLLDQLAAEIAAAILERPPQE